MSTHPHVPHGILLALGNPLLDISANVETKLLEKYELKDGNSILAEPKHLGLYEDLVKNYQVEYIAGGAAQNTIRAAQWMIESQGATSYIGAIGKDGNGKILQQAAEKGGVHTYYYKDEIKPTGTCAVCIHQKERSLVANLAAAETYSKEKHFDTPEIQEVVNKAQFIYTTGFFLTHGIETAVAIGKHCAEKNKTFIWNISATFLVDYFWDNVSRVLPYADIVVGNETEAACLGKKLGWGEDLAVIAKKLSEEYPKENKKRERIVIFTQGAKATFVYYDHKLHEFHPLKVAKEDIVDTNGAGDSFVGGFLSRYVQGKSIEESVAAGHYCASECIKRSGATYPPKPHFHFP